MLPNEWNWPKIGQDGGVGISNCASAAALKRKGNVRVRGWRGDISEGKKAVIDQTGMVDPFSSVNDRLEIKPRDPLSLPGELAGCCLYGSR